MEGLDIDSLAVLPTIALVELSGWLVGGLTDERERERGANTDRKLLPPRPDESELLSEGPR